jgi:hypothetical protein
VASAALVGVAALLFAGAPQAGAAGPAAGAPGWRITKIFGASAGYPALQGLTSTGRDNSWIVGTTTQSLVIEHWDGSAWRPLAGPADLTNLTQASVNDGVVGAPSATDLWTFPDLNGPSGDVLYALHWNGRRWQQFRLKGASAIGSTAAFSQSDAWAFGEAPTKQSGLGFGPPYAARYDGHAWRRVAMPGVPIIVNPLAPADIWAFGPTRKTAINTRTKEVMIAMRWDGKTWQVLPVPRLALPGNRELPIVYSFAAFGRRDLWATEGYPGSLCGCGLPNLGVLLMHWNGSRWRRVIVDRDVLDPFSLVSDGRGGLWLTAVRRSGAQELLARAGYSTGIAQLTLIPGLTSLWGIGSLTPAGPGSSPGAIFKYGA